MKKRTFTSFALAGLSAGMLISSHVQGAAVEKETTDKPTTETGVKQGDDGEENLMSEKELKEQLNAEGLALYNSLDAKGKELAIKTASAICNGHNECRGLNTCKSDKNACKGKGSCKGQSTCAILDKNDAVKLVDQRLKMENKRNGTLSQ